MAGNFYPVANCLLSSWSQATVPAMSEKMIRSPVVADVTDHQLHYWWRITDEAIVFLRTIKGEAPFTPNDYLLFKTHVAAEYVCDSSLVVARAGRRDEPVLCAVEYQSSNLFLLSPLKMGKNKKPIAPFVVSPDRMGAIWTCHLFREQVAEQIQE